MAPNGSWTRRDFLHRSALTAAALAVPVHAFSSSSRPADQFKVGLIGCGGRGSGAATDAAAAHPGVVIWSMGDVFADRLEGTKGYLQDQLKERFQATPERCYTGFDAYKKVIDSGVDVVILTSPPGFRPVHLRAAVDAGKHVFMEKPVATDAPGVRSIFESSDIAKAKNLCIVAGTQRRHDIGYRECMKRVQDGAIGDIVSLHAYWNQGGLWMFPREESWSDMEWQLRNWLYFTWLSGDMIAEQHIHNIDVCNWAMGTHPVRAISLGGRQVRVDPAYGHIYDHFATEFEYENGVKMVSMCRQIDGCANRVSEHIVGTKGTTNAVTSIKGENPWRWDGGDKPSPYMLEHKNLFDAIVSGQTINEGRQVGESTLSAIMGRMAAYTGQEITWDMALNSQEVLVPTTLEMASLGVPPVAMPGKTTFA